MFTGYAMSDDAGFRRRMLWPGAGSLAGGGVLYLVLDLAEHSFRLDPQLDSLIASLVHFGSALTTILLVGGASMLTMSLLRPRRRVIALVCLAWATLDFITALLSDPFGRTWLIGRSPDWFAQVWLLPTQGPGWVHFGEPGGRLFVAATAALLAYLWIAHASSTAPHISK